MRPGTRKRDLARHQRLTDCRLFGLGLPASRAGRNEFPWVLSHSAYGVLLRQLERTKAVAREEPGSARREREDETGPGRRSSARKGPEWVRFCLRGAASVRASRGQVASEMGRGRATRGLKDRGEVV